jgi:hypothetical protein
MPCHPERERSPATAKFQNGLSILEISMFCSHAKAQFLGFIEVSGVSLPKAATVFALLSQNELEKLRGQLVMLFICLLGQDSDGTFGHGLDEGFDIGIEIFAVLGGERDIPLPGKPTDTQADERLWDPAMLGKNDGQGKRHQDTSFAMTGHAA